MKKIFSLVIALSVCAVSNAQIEAGFLNDFEDGTTQGWSNGGSSPNPPTNVPDGGPGGAGDGFLEEISGGGAGPGSRMIIFNGNPEWLGDYSNAVVVALDFDAKVPTNDDLLLRVAMEGGSDDTAISSTIPVTIPGQSSWSGYTISLLPSDFTIVSGSNTVEEVLQDVVDVRILHSTDPSYIGESIEATLHLDNITAIGSFGINDALINSFKTSPNPVQNELHLRAEIHIDTYIIYNLLGAKVGQGTVSNSEKTIDVSALTTGTYLIEVTSQGQSSSQKFIKQ